MLYSNDKNLFAFAGKFKKYSDESLTVVNQFFEELNFIAEKQKVFDFLKPEDPIVVLSEKGMEGKFLVKKLLTWGGFMKDERIVTKAGLPMTVLLGKVCKGNSDTSSLDCFVSKTGETVERVRASVYYRKEGQNIFTACVGYGSSAKFFSQELYPGNTVAILGKYDEERKSMVIHGLESISMKTSVAIKAS